MGNHPRKENKNELTRLAVTSGSSRVRSSAGDIRNQEQVRNREQKCSLFFICAPYTNHTAHYTIYTMLSVTVPYELGDRYISHNDEDEDEGDDDHDDCVIVNKKSVAGKRESLSFFAVSVR